MKVGSIESSIRSKTNKALAPKHIELVNESRLHSRNPRGETHFNLFVVSESFVGMPLVKRHQLVMQLFEQERAQGLHALTLRTLTPDEWRKKTQDSQGVQKDAKGALDSPACQHGPKDESD